MLLNFYFSHFRCLVDSGFAHIRKPFRRSDVDSLGQFHTLINKSAATNEAVLFQSGAWKWRNWKYFLSSQFRAVKGIRRFHHFRVTADDPWTVYLKERIDGEEKPMSIRKTGATPFDATELSHLALHLSDSNICTGLFVHT